jgi:hypothetical protein
MTLSWEARIVGIDPDRGPSPLLLRLAAGTLPSLPLPSPASTGRDPAEYGPTEDDAR